MNSLSKLLIIAVFTVSTAAAQTIVPWFATTGDVVLSGAATAATIQQRATNSSVVNIDSVVVYCSAACTITVAINGTAATTTAGTITPISPAPANQPILLDFFTASNVGTSTAQGGLIHVPAGSTVPLCFSPLCGNAQQFQLPPGGTSRNFTVSVASVTATVNFTFYGRSLQ